MKYAKTKIKREAVVAALIDYNRRKRMAELVRYSAVSETFLSNEALEALDSGSCRAKAAPRDRRGKK